MRPCRLTPLVTIAAVAGAARASDPPTHPAFLNTRDVVVSFDARGPAQRAELWISQDAGQTWHRVQAPRWDRSSLLFTAPADGRYELYLRLIGPTPMPEPTPGTIPHQSLVIDTVPPIVQIRSATPTRDPPGIELELIVIEEHLGHDAIRLLYRTAEDNPWTDSGLHPTGSGRVLLPLPDDAAGRIDLRLIATDEAGNRGLDERLGLDIRPAREPVPASQPASPPPQPPARAPQEPPGPDPQTQARIRQLRSQAERKLSLARYAEARRLLQQALDLSPSDPDLLSLLGMTWLRSGNRDKAEQLLKQALTKENHPRALEGLALIAALRHDWPAARDRLRELLSLEPDSALTWLRLGDIEHRMGQREAALSAWRRAASLSQDPQLKRRARERLTLLGRAR